VTRRRSKTSGFKITLAMPVSSSMLRNTKPLAVPDRSGDFYSAAVGHVFYLRGGDDSHAIQMLAVEAHGVGADRQALVCEVRVETF
jgi:hypothetical protein